MLRIIDNQCALLCASNNANNSSEFVLTLYDLGERISSVWPKFRFKKKKGSLKKFPMSAASMSR